MHPEGARPPEKVVRAFGASGDGIALHGGLRQSAWRFGNVVLKEVEEYNPGEGDWVADVLDAMAEDGFRVIKPVRSDDGRWLVDRWTAWSWMDGDHVRSGWVAVANAARVFHAALRNVAGDDRPAWLDTREHRWARSERTVWHGAPMPPTQPNSAVEWSMWERAIAIGAPLSQADRKRCQVVHGDVAGNTLVDAMGVYGFIDMSPGWRTPESSSVQVLVEAVAWFGADPALLDGVDRADAARAVAFRLLCGLQSIENWATAIPEEVVNWERVLRTLGA